MIGPSTKPSDPDPFEAALAGLELSASILAIGRTTLRTGTLPASLSRIRDTL